MTTMTRFVPFRAPLEDIAVLQNRLNSIFHDFAMPSNGTETEALAAGNFVPAVDIYEDPHRLLLKLEVPGIRQQDLDIRVENQTLTVKGERKFAQDEREENFHRIERRFGTFVRSFTLPMTVETGSVKAVYDAGVGATNSKRYTNSFGEGARIRLSRFCPPGHLSLCSKNRLPADRLSL